MRELTELRFNDDRVILKDNHVKTSILPMVSNELDRDVDIEGNCVLDGAVDACDWIEIRRGQESENLKLLK
ncbi:MAG: hypothetical protein WCK63_19285 [Betaproteobacteria bacterium]